MHEKNHQRIAGFIEWHNHLEKLRILLAILSTAPVVADSATQDSSTTPAMISGEAKFWYQLRAF